MGHGTWRIRSQAAYQVAVLKGQYRLPSDESALAETSRCSRQACFVVGYERESQCSGRGSGMNKGGPRDIAPPSSVRCIVLFTAPKLFYPARARQNRPEAQEHRRISEPSMPAPACLRPLACQQYTTQPIITAATMSTARFVTGSKKLDELCSAAPWPPRLIVAAAAA